VINSATVVAGIDVGDVVVAANVHAGVAQIEDLIESELACGDVILRDEVLHLFRAGGKRFRPLFTVLAAQLGPNPNAWQVTVAGAVIELVHLATLYHDDVMDEARIRRSVPSANALWDNRVAILAGDYLFATASRLTSRLGPEAVKVIADTFAQLVTGQVRESRGSAAGLNDVNLYLQVVHEKTASLIAASGRFGAMFSGADHNQVERLDRLGALVGTIFQIIDDIIDIDSDPDESGKLAGTDLKEGVHTLPVLYALQESGSEARRLQTLLATPVDTEAKLAECLSLLRGSGGIARAKATVAEYVTRAHDEIAMLPACNGGRDALAALLDFTVARNG
jgi:heptaprenyl diphosphate synthase